MRHSILVAIAAASLLAASCGSEKTEEKSTPEKPAAAPSEKTGKAYSGVGRGSFNSAAALLNLPVFWVEDANQNREIDADEVASLLFYPTKQEWVKDGQLTERFGEAFARIAAVSKKGLSYEGLTDDEAERRRLVAKELNQGRPTLVRSDLAGLSGGHEKILEHLLEAAEITDRLFAVQSGAAALAARVPADDPASQSLFRRNWGPVCKAPRTESNPACSAIPGAPEPAVDSYPAALQEKEGFCDEIGKLPDAEKLLDPFTVVRDKDGALIAVPAHEEYKKLSSAIAEELDAAAKAAEGIEGERALAEYLAAAADAYRNGEWQRADESWAKMNAENSKWYVRAAPDETYWDPCNRKAGYHLTLALINPASLEWQQKLQPVRQEMEAALAELIGEPYEERQVSFHLPDFIDIVVNAGNDRSNLGAIIGQSLPNWGPVANEGRGRTVAMTNLYTDPDSVRIRRLKAASLLSDGNMNAFPRDPEAGLLGVILHESTHNLGPSHEYAYRGQTDDQAFGGPLATVMEELKAQTGAVWFVDFLKKRGIIDEKLASESYLDAFIWACGHISRGMYTATGRPKPYSQLAAIQVGFMMKEGAITFDPETPAGRGEDPGVFSLDPVKGPAVVEKLMRIVGRIKATNDKAGAEALVKEFVDGDIVPMGLITERMLRHPKASFVYSVAH